MPKLTEIEKRDLNYHDWCRSVVNKHGWILYGSSFNSGCSILIDGKPVIDIHHEVLLALDKG